MRTGFLEIGPEELDLETTMEVGQTFSWHKSSGENLYDGEGDRYYTTRDGEVLIIWQGGERLYYKASGGMEKEIDRRLRLHESLSNITEELEGSDEVLDSAMERYQGLRILNDDIFPCLISYLCSPQMRIPRIKKMFDTISEKYGTPVEKDGRKFLQFPTVEELSDATEEDLRQLGVGYRAKYIVKTVERIQKGVVDLERLEEMDYYMAHEEIKKLYGVGDKVGDCVLLFGAGHTEAFPVDTWIKKAVKRHYPDMYHKDYMELADNFREYFGKYTGYAQEYLFHHMRNQESNS